MIATDNEGNPVRLTYCIKQCNDYMLMNQIQMFLS